MSEDQKKCNALKKIERHEDFIEYGEECGQPAAYRVKFQQGAWPMNWGNVVFCDDCGQKLWEELKELLDL